MSTQAGPADRGARRVIGAEHIRQAHQQRKISLEILPADLVTAEAADQAERLGIELVEGPLPRPEPPTQDGAVALRRALWRRSPRWVTPNPSVRGTPARFRRIAFIGAGGVGTHAAHLVAHADMADEMVLIDITPGRAAAMAMDLNHAAGISGSRTRAEGSTSPASVAGADLVLVTAGRARQPGMNRSDLLEINRRIIHEAGTAIATHAPEAIVLVVTNPLDEMTFAMWQATGFARSRVLGMAGTLDSGRFRSALAKAAGVVPRDVTAFALGSHGDEMVPIVSQARIRGRTLQTFLSPQQIEACVRDAVTGGGQVVALKRTGSAIIAPAHGAVEIMDHIRGARQGTVPVSVILEGEYGLHDVVLGVPCHLGREGLVRVEEIALAPDERTALEQAAQAIRARLDTGTALRKPQAS